MITIMIPAQVMVVPQYIILKKIHLIDTRVALILPWCFGGAFFIFLMVQFFQGIPKELDEDFDLLAIAVEQVARGWMKRQKLTDAER